MDQGLATRRRASVLNKELYDITQAMVKLSHINAEVDEKRRVDRWMSGYEIGRNFDCERQGSGR